MIKQDFFKGCADRRILVVAGERPCRAVSLEQHSGLGPGHVDTCVFGVTCGQVSVRREVDKRERAALQAGDAVELAIAVTIGGENVLHIEAFAISITLGLLHTLERVFVFFLGFQHRDGQRSRHLTHLHAEQIVCAPWTLTAAAFCTTGFDRGWGKDGFKRDVFTADVTFVAQHRINQMVPSIRFVHAHRFIGLLCAVDPSSARAARTYKSTSDSRIYTVK
ncbi:hypothetical protein D3C81_1626780 [compost metagenome]